jgi:hypothetical protein
MIHLCWNKLIIFIVFDLPPEILDTIKVKSTDVSTVDQTGTSLLSSQTHQIGGDLRSTTADGAPANATSCALCGLSFPTVQDQRNHIRSDLHGYNLKQKIKGQKPINETEFEKLIGELDESISGSDSSESEEDESEGVKAKDTTLSALLKRQAKISSSEEDFSISKRRKGTGKPPLFWFSSSSLPPDVSVGVYRAIFSVSEQEEEEHLVDSLRRKQLTPVKAPTSSTAKTAAASSSSSPHYFLCMIGGGHFAAMIVALAPKVGKNHAGVDARSATVLQHKTFHRYTTRRKQGGSQSANDAAKGAAHSAGSALRRYNEAALTQEVRQLLEQWKDMIDTAELLFIRATGSTNRRTLFGPYDGQVLRTNDPRNRGFPFSTRRATQNELMRAFIELTRVKVSRISEASLTASNEVNTEAPTAPKPAKPSAPKLSKEQESALQIHTTQITSLIKRSKAPALLSYLYSNSLSPNFAFHPPSQYGHTPYPLHLAASLNNPIIILALLTKSPKLEQVADPSLRNESDKPPFLLATDKSTRDAFRVARSELGEDAFDWISAGVPAALPRSEYEKRMARDVEERKAQETAESERRKAETQRLQEESKKAIEAEREKRIGKGRALGAVEKTAAEKREEEARGMTPEMRLRIERERRARAAEERIRKMQGGGR